MYSYNVRLKTDDNLNNKNFYSDIWKNFYYFINKDSENIFIIDLSNIKFINPVVLPKLCCLGIIAKRYNKEIEIIIDSNSNVKYYLSQLGFFEIVNKHKILFIDDGLTGGIIEENKITNKFVCFEKKQLYLKYDRLYTFSEILSESDKLKFCIIMEIFGEQNHKHEVNEDTIKLSPILKVLRELGKDYNQIEQIGLDFAELIHNSIWHGSEICFFAVQAGSYKKDSLNKFSKVDISVADVGNGLYDTLSKKDWKNTAKTTSSIYLNDFLNLEIDKDKYYHSILECILYRRNEKIRGIYDIIENLSRKKEPYISFTNNSLLLFLNDDNIKKILQDNYEIKNKGKCLDNINYGLSLDISFGI